MKEAESVSTQHGTWSKLSDRRYRHALAVAQFKRFVPFQIGALRKERRWSQEELARESGLTQGVISKAEDPDNGNLTVNTILRIANGFDVVFVGKFVPYSEFDHWRRELSEDAVVLGYEQEKASMYTDSLEKDLNPIAIEAQKDKQKAVINIEDWRKKMQGKKQKENRDADRNQGQPLSAAARG